MRSKTAANIKAVEASLRHASSLFVNKLDDEMPESDVLEGGPIADEGTRKFHAEAISEQLDVNIADVRAILKKIGEPKRDVQAALNKLEDIENQFERLYDTLYGKKRKEEIVKRMRDLVK